MNDQILQQQTRISAEILKSYRHPQPFHLHLKEKFRQLRKAGSRDRRIIRSMCYAWFRLGRTFKDELSDQIFHAYSLLEQWNAQPDKSMQHLMELIHQKYPDWEKTKLNPFKSEVSDAIPADQIDLLYLSQPLVWIWNTSAQQVNEDEAFVWEQYPWAKGMPAGKELNTDQNNIQVQDLSSQIMCRSLPLKGNEAFWDACAASGGKSLHVMKLFPDVKLWVSDNRKTILDQLKLRFLNAGIRAYRWAVLDLNVQIPQIDFSGFKVSDQTMVPESLDFILLDVPCTGSGTWGRNPENIDSFNPENIQNFFEQQEKMIQNVWPFLRKGGWLCYSTCSIFSKENEYECDFVE